jgi:tetratricopeptide (TPR) repeat protein
MTVGTMKKAILLALILFVPAASTQTPPATMLFDGGHTTLDVENRFALLVGTLRDNGYNVSFNYGDVTSELLQTTDIFVIALPTTRFSDAEKGAILNFVTKGGGLLLVGESKGYDDDYGILLPLNDISLSFGILFQADAIRDEDHNISLRETPYPEIPLISDMVSHPVTMGVKQFFLGSGSSLKVLPPAFTLAFASGSAYPDKNDNQKKDADEGGAIIVLAASEYGDGRVVAIGDSDLWRSREASSLPYERDQIEYLDNKKLAKNIFFWLSSKPYLRSVVSLMDEAQQLFQNGNFLEAKNKLTSALSLLAHIGSTQYIEEINKLLEKAEEGIRADNLMTGAEKAFGERKYDEAKTDFAAAQNLYKQIGSPKENNAKDRIDFIDKILQNDERKQEADGLFDKGISEFNKGNCKDAQDYFRKAKAIYAELRDTQKANLCTDYIQKCTKEETGISSFIFMLFFLLRYAIHSHR